MNSSPQKLQAIFALVGSCMLLLLASGCAVTDWFPSASPLKRVTTTPVIRPTFTPRPTSTAWPTFTPVPTTAPVTPGVLTGEITATVNVRSGPGTDYSILTKLNKGTQIGARGRDLNSQWLFLVPPPSNGWVNATFVNLKGELSTLPVVEAPPPPTQTPTVQPSPTAMPTATPPMYVDFRVDAPFLPAGQCTTVRWDVEGVRDVYLDGQGQPGHGSQDICPRETHTYVLHVVLNSGYLDRALTVTVFAIPSATSRP